MKYILRSPAIVDACKRQIDAVSNEGKLHEVEIRPHKKRRSVNQNARYWAILGHIAEQTGHSPDELHDYFKHQFLGTPIEIFGEPIVRRPSTTALSVSGFEDYMTRIDAWCAEHGYFTEANYG